MPEQKGAAPERLITSPERLWVARALTEELAAPLSPEDQTVQSMPDVSPTKWHRGHTTWFFETFVLGPHASAYEPFDHRFGYVFNSYYEAIGPRHPRTDRGLLSRPGAEEVAAYRRHVDAHLLRLLDEAVPESVDGLLELGLQHEQQHQELLLMDIKHVLSVNPLDPVYRPGRRRERRATPDDRWLPCEGGLVEIGHDGGRFAFDNESPRHAVFLAPFAVAGQPVTNGEWLCFIDDGGYTRPELWLSDGWAAVQAEGWHAPLYWSRDGGTWSAFTLAGVVPLDSAEPVCHVSYYEADAFARWAGCRLPTEAEWEHVLGSEVGANDRFDLDDLHPRPAISPQDLCVGEVWEWTASAYLPYPGFRPPSGAIGEYNGKFMVSQHVLRGGSCVTPPGHARPTYRNFFPPAARWPFSGLRLAKDLDAPEPVLPRVIGPRDRGRT